MDSVELNLLNTILIVGRDPAESSSHRRLVTSEVLSIVLRRSLDRLRQLADDHKLEVVHSSAHVSRGHLLAGCPASPTSHRTVPLLASPQVDSPHARCYARISVTSRLTRVRIWHSMGRASW